MMVLKVAGRVLEPEIANIYMNGDTLDLDVAIALSQAASLRRIADTLEGGLMVRGDPDAETSIPIVIYPAESE